MLRWLEPIDTHSDLNSLKNNPHRQACEWIHSNEEFSRWSLPNEPLEPTSTPQLLWLSAIAGSGKTYLCARIVEESISTGWDVAYFFCNINDESKRSILGILKTLAYQFLRQNPGQLDIFSEAYNKAEQLGETFLGSAISRLIQGGRQCRLIVDGLDECDEKVRKSVLRLAMSLKPEGRMLIASRFEPDIEDDLEMLRAKSGRVYAKVSIRKVDNAHDVLAYLQCRISELPLRALREAKNLDMDQQKYEEQTMQSLSEASDGMFMWVRLMVDELSLQMSLANFEKTLQHPPKGLNGVYERVVFRINHFPSEKRSITVKMLQWITCSMRPLRVDEMAEAVAIEFNAPFFDKSKRLLDGKNIYSRVVAP